MRDDSSAVPHPRHARAEGGREAAPRQAVRAQGLPEAGQAGGEQREGVTFQGGAQRYSKLTCVFWRTLAVSNRKLLSSNF